MIPTAVGAGQKLLRFVPRLRRLSVGAVASRSYEKTCETWTLAPAERGVRNAPKWQAVSMTTAQRPRVVCPCTHSQAPRLPHRFAILVCYIIILVMRTHARSPDRHFTQKHTNLFTELERISIFEGVLSRNGRRTSPSVF